MPSILNVVNFALYFFGALFIVVDYHFALIPNSDKPLSYVTHQIIGVITATSFVGFLATLIEFASAREINFLSFVVQASWAFISYLDYEKIKSTGAVYPQFFIVFPLLTATSSLLLFLQNLDESDDKEESKPVLVYIILLFILITHSFASYADALHQTADTPFLRPSENGTFVPLTKPVQPLEHVFQSLVGVCHFVGVYSSFGALTGMISTSSAALMVYTMQGIWATVIFISNKSWGKVFDPNVMGWDVLASIHLGQCFLSLFMYFLIQRSQAIPQTHFRSQPESSQPSVVESSNSHVQVNENSNKQQEISNSQPNQTPSKSQSLNQSPVKSQSNNQTPSKSQSLNQSPVKEEVSTPVTTPLKTPESKKKSGSTTKPRVPRLLRELQMSDGWKAKNQGEQHIEEYIKEEYNTK